MKKNKHCPLDFSEECMKENCMWFSEKKENCIIFIAIKHKVGSL